MSDDTSTRLPASDPDDAEDPVQRLDDAIASLGATLREARDDPRLDLTPVLQRRIRDRIGPRDVELVVQPVDAGPAPGDVVRAVVDATGWIADLAADRITVRVDAGPDSLRFFVGARGDLQARDLRDRLDDPDLAKLRDVVDGRDGELFVDARFDAVGLGWTVPR